MDATVFTNFTNGIAIFSPDIAPGSMLGETLTATISGATACAGCFLRPTESLYYKILAGTINGTFTLTRPSTASLLWSTTGGMGTLSIGQYSDSACTTPTALTPVPGIRFVFNCSTKKWEFSISAQASGTIVNLWNPTTTQLGCDVVANTVSIDNTTLTCAAATATNGIFAGGTASVPLCP